MDPKPSKPNSPAAGAAQVPAPANHAPGFNTSQPGGQGSQKRPDAATLPGSSGKPDDACPPDYVQQGDPKPPKPSSPAAGVAQVPSAANPPANPDTPQRGGRVPQKRPGSTALPGSQAESNGDCPPGYTLQGEPDAAKA
ncbi:hypothetical protein GQ602_006906 [Ophiocordyceps camponoti-floridani]|uniref:Uncharacterized protein n=1 Tax=Ophiocordyceps camponoti-floridani TaxID=2030778 RepID=A0A8H4Q269_9HYPO|nr:hypothetical protein GQ602_006906 [Ophiocordyceps camponoti-floridani]